MQQRSVHVYEEALISHGGGLQGVAGDVFGAIGVQILDLSFDEM